MAKLFMSTMFLAVLFTIGASCVCSAAPTAAPESSRDTTRALKEGLLVMVRVAQSFTTSKELRDDASRMCQVIEYVNGITYNKTETEGAAAAAEKIKNDTCNWLNVLSEGTIETCSNEALDMFCLRNEVFVNAGVAAGAVSAITFPNLAQWIRDHIEEGPIRDYICNRRPFPLC